MPLHKLRRAAGSSTPLGLSQTDTYSSASQAGSYTATSASFGSAPSGGQKRWVVVSIGGRNQNGSATIDSVTIGGQAGTVLSSNADGITGARAAIYVAEVSSGTTGNIVVDVSGSSGGTWDWCAMCVYRIVSGVSADLTSSYAEDNADEASGVCTMTLNVVANGAVIAAVAANDAGTTSWSGTVGVLEDQEINPETGDRLSSASVEIAATASSQTAIGTNTDSTPQSMAGVAVSWGPLGAT